jgi:hypothetical protein
VQEELEALLAIYGEDINISPDGRSVEIKLGNGVGRSVKFLLPTDYPASSPITDLNGFPRGYSMKLESGEYADICERTINGPALFDLISFFRGEAMLDNLAAEELKELNSITSLQITESRLSSYIERDVSESVVDDVPIFHGPQVIDRKSVFVSHIARVTSLNDISNVMAQLQTDSRIARATHNMFAYRFRDIKGSLHADNDDDGEESAGSRLAELLDLMKVENVLVVVSRWFGGVLLGPSRFRTILNCAREAIEIQSWYVKR